MKKKRVVVAAALASCFAITASLTGCSLVSTNNKADMAQVVATVNITKSDKFKESNNPLSAYESAISETSIIKRNMVSYFLNVGYSYVQNGSSYADTFNMLIDALIDNAVLVQYSTLELLAAKASEAGNTAQSVLAEYNKAETKSAKYEYLLDEDEIALANYNLYKSLNSALDNYEKRVIEEEDGYKGTDTRTTPVNLNTEQDDYYPQKDGKLDYYVYTGYENYLLKDSGAYKDDALEGTTRATRVKAYNRFLNNLRTNNLIDTETEADKLTDIMSLNYIEDEYVNQLESRIINKYYDIYEDDMEAKLLGGDGYDYLQYVYEELFKDQKAAYENDHDAFESALSNMSSSSFLLYSPNTEDSEFELDGNYGTKYGRYGFVYNILLPFSAKQNAKLSELKSILSADEKNDYYYVERNKLLKEIKTEDQRAAWFNGETDYSFKASEKGLTAYGASDYLFFEGNLTDSEEGGRYKKLQAYEGSYSYNGNVYENEDGSYTLIGNKLDINGMLKEFSEYVNYVITGDKNGDKVDYTVNDSYYVTKEFSLKDEQGEDIKGEIDYSKLLYASGKVKFGEFKNSDLLNPNAASDQYKAMSAVNELQFAYTTDTSVLSQYVGYSVSAYDTNYIKEFEYAAKLAISNGAGSFTVCAGDYGWHLIYVTYVFDKEEMYTPVWSRVTEEGTFENQFFEWVKSTDLSDVTSSRRSKIINDYNKEDVSVVKYQKRYQDLLDLKSN